MAEHHDQASESLAAQSGVCPQAVCAPPAVPDGSVLAGEAVEHDLLSDVLRVVKLSGALFFVVDASSPWAVDVPRAELFAPIIFPRARHVISYHIITEGTGWAFVPGGEPPVRFVAGDLLLFPHGDPYAMHSAPGPQPEPPPGNALQFFRAMAAGELPFVVTEGGGGAERAKFVCGFLGCDARPFNPLLTTLPRLLHVNRRHDSRGDLVDRLVELTLAEAGARRPGGECIRLRLSELLFVEVVRRYVETLPADQAGWLAGLRDPGVGHALALLHARPAYAWTLEELARQAGMSRSVLADRFTQLVGHPPMQYLTHWRIQMAARLLADGATKVAAVAQEVGYASEAAFSRSFKRIAGVSPSAWRTDAAS
jgi:AraC-like DNA-binding protein